jgi:hypothetical protein
VTGTWVWVNTRPNPPSRWLMSMRCSAGPLALALVDEHVATNLIGSTPGWEEFGALASRSKKLFSLDNSNLMEVMKESTFELYQCFLHRQITRSIRSYDSSSKVIW